MRKYEILEANNANDLANLVNDLMMDDGWRPQGGIVVIIRDEALTLAQAMVKDTGVTSD